MLLVQRIYFIHTLHSHDLIREATINSHLLEIKSKAEVYAKWAGHLKIFIKILRCWTFFFNIVAQKKHI